MSMNRSSLFGSGGKMVRRLTGFISALSILVLAVPVLAQEHNQLLAVNLEQGQGGPVVKIRTESPVGYRYTVYDSFDPVRVVIDFPGMETARLEETAVQPVFPVKDVKISSFDLDSGKLGRVEIFLDQSSTYDVELANGSFSVTFNPPPKAAESPAAVQTTVQDMLPVSTPAERTPAVGPADLVSRPEVTEGSAVLPANGPIARHSYFELNAPPRLVVDIYNAQPDFRERSFPAGQGMRRLRVGTYQDKTRFVFDAEGGALPQYSVVEAQSALKITWTGTSGAGEVKQSVPGVGSAVSKPSVVIEALDFNAENGRSSFVVSLGSRGEVLPASQEGSIVSFGVKNAELSQKLRRTIDASAFPSAVRLITPYTVQAGPRQDVRFAVELKGPVAYSLIQNGNQVELLVEDGAYAVPRSAGVAVKNVELPTVADSIGKAAGTKASGASATAPAQVLAKSAEMLKESPLAETEGTEAGQMSTLTDGSIRIGEGQTEYVGEKISLVFDNAEVRNILQLIGEVSQLNIIASDEVKGNITLRLQDVPWDQALELVMEIKDLGMIRQGNVARIMPRERIRAMEESKLTAKRTKERLEDLVTEVISVSHADLAAISKPATDLLSDRGKITQDPRNKQVIVTDIPTAIADIRRLISLLDTPERQVLIEARIVEANSNFARDLGVKWGFDYTDPSGTGGGITDAQIGLGGSFLINPAAEGPGIGSSFTFGRLFNNASLDLRISALETSGEGKVVSMPRIATLNGEAALISQGTKIPYQSISDSGTETKFENAELKLEVTPVINPDGSIIMEIKASNSSVGATVPTGVGNAIAIDEKKAETKVLLQDGETTVIGGIFVEDTRSSESGVPLLMHIPLLGHMFKSETKSADRRELLIFITPRILL